MASVPAPAPAASTQDAAEREKEFFTTWLRLMERQKDATNLTQAMQSLLAQTKDATVKLQDARHQANMLSANDKTMAELVAQLNEFFFRDIVPALKRAKEVVAAGSNTSNRQAQDPLDRYLEQGDEGATMSQTFVDNMSGWGATEGPEREQSKAKKSDSDEDDSISGDMFHDFLIANSLKLTAMQAPDYSARVPGRVIQQQSVAPTAATGTQMSEPSPTTASPRATKGKGKTMANRRGRVVPPPIATDLPPRSASGSAGTTPQTQSRSPTEAAQKKDRIGKRTAASLIAEQVLGVRTYGSAREYFIRWQGVQAPLWISRRKAPQQAKELIDLYAAALRSRVGAASSQGATDQNRRVSHKGRKKTSRDGASLRQGQQRAGSAGAKQAEFYTVDHIVNHRLHYNRRQYLVRWENYAESQDTWENADKLRADVPEIVDAYEDQLQRDRARAEAVQSAMSELIRDVGPKTTKTKRSIGESGREGSADKSKLPSPVSEEGVRPKEKRRRIDTDKENKSNGADGDNTSEDDYQFDLEEAELEEFSDEEFADKLNN